MPLSFFKRRSASTAFYNKTCHVTGCLCNSQISLNKHLSNCWHSWTWPFFFFPAHRRNISRKTGFTVLRISNLSCCLALGVHIEAYLFGNGEDPIRNFLMHGHVRCFLFRLKVRQNSQWFCSVLKQHSPVPALSNINPMLIIKQR